MAFKKASEASYYLRPGIPLEYMKRFNFILKLVLGH